MKKLFDKSDVGFAVTFIILYVLGNSLGDRLSEAIGITKLVTSIFDLILVTVLLIFIQSSKLASYFGLCRPCCRARKYLFYAPLLVLSTTNIWFGIRLNMSIFDSVCYFVSMLLVGFLEELIFRGLLFKAMMKENTKSAIIVGSILFGAGHIINLFNGSGISLTSNIMQIAYATALGFLFVSIFYKSGSLWPCIVTHCTINSLSTFANQPQCERYLVQISLVIILISALYSAWIWRRTIDSRAINAHQYTGGITCPRHAKSK